MANASQITIVRASHAENYTKISNRILQNQVGLPIEARVILLDMLSRARDWEVSIEHLCKTHGFGRDRCYRALGELREAGFARLDTPRDPETGRVGKRRWLIFEEPENRFPEIQESGAAGFLKSPVSGYHRFPENQDAYKEKKYKQTKDSPTKPAPPPAAREGAGDQLSEESSSSTPPDRPDMWQRFKTAWPWQAGAESVTAAQRVFGQLSEADQELCARGAEAFQPPSGRRVSAWAFIGERHWAFSPRRSAAGASRAATAGASARACRRPDGSWWLAPDSLQLQRWHEFERATSIDRRAKRSCIRPSEWPPSRPATQGPTDRGSARTGMMAGPSSRSKQYGRTGCGGLLEVRGLAKGEFLPQG